MFTISCRKLRSTYSTTGKLKCQYIWLLAQRCIPSSPPQRQRLGPVRRLLTLMRASHPVRHRWPLRNRRFFCSRLRVALLEERLGMQTPGHIEGGRNESEMTLIGEALVQFGGKIGAHNLQKFGAEFRSALGKLPHVLQVPFGKPCGSACHDVHWTDEAAIGTRIADELSGTEHYHGLATENRFSFAGNEDNRVRNLVTLLDDYLARREVDPVGKAHHF